MTASISGILHININCEDLEKSRSFYELLGFCPVIQFPEGEYPEIGKGLGVGRHRVKGLLMRIGNDERATMLDLLQWLEPQSGGTAARPAFAQGIARIALHTADIDLEYGRLRAAGVAFITEPIHVVGPTGVPGKFACFKDPDGNLLEFIEVPK
jgi:glyoxylase I family protein